MTKTGLFARPFTLFPNIGHEIFNESRPSFKAEIKKTNVKSINGMMNLIWYEAQIKRLGEEKNQTPS